MSGLFGQLLQAGLQMATQDNPANAHQRGQGGSLLEGLGNQMQNNRSQPMNQGGLMDALGGMLGGQQGGGLLGNVGSALGGQSGRLGNIGNMLGGNKGALVAGALGMLMTSKAGRRLAGKLVKVGGMGAIGMMAFKAFQNYNQTGGNASQVGNLNSNDFGKTVDQLEDENDVNQRSFMLMKAMIAAAKADGQVDAEEQTAIQSQIDAMGIDDAELAQLRDELAKPLDASDVAAAASSPSAAAEMYLVSKLVVDVDSPQEQQYLNSLAAALGLNPEMVQYLDQQAASA